MKKNIVLFSLVFLAAVLRSHGQIEQSGFKAGAFATSYLSDYQCLGINVANLGWTRQDKNVNIGIGEFGFSAFSDAITKERLRNDFISAAKNELNEEEKRQAAIEFSKHRLSFNLDFALISLSVQQEKLGGIALSVRNRISGDFNFNETVSNLMFLGMNYMDYFDIVIDPSTNRPVGIAKTAKLYSDIFDGSRLTMSWYTEYYIGYGRKVLDLSAAKLYVGAGYKYIQGYGIIDIGAEDGNFTGYTALSPVFNIDYGEAATNSQSYIEGQQFENVGSGYGLDFGVTFESGNFRASVAVNDIGSITWDGNVFTAKDVYLDSVNFDGFNNYNILWEAEQIYSDAGVFEWEGEVEKKVNLATNMRMGASIVLEEKFDVGADIFIPLNDNPGQLHSVAVGVGANIRPVKWFELSTGYVNGGVAKSSIPLGICFSVLQHSWEIGLSTRDALTWIKQDSPHLSLAFGFMRFRF